MYTQRPRFVLSPCGTSTLTNYVERELRELLFANANKRHREEVDEVARGRIEDHIAARRLELGQASALQAARLSAEINPIVCMYGGELRSSSGTPDIHCLLGTDTWLGQTTCAMVGDWLHAQGLNVHPFERISGLRTLELEEFQGALTELTRWCAETLPGYRDAGYEVVFNLTGGFKSIQGFLQTLAAFYADESIYLFETGDSLLRIPRLPIELRPEDAVRRNFAVFRRLATLESLAATECQGVPETLLYRLSDEVELSAWGRMVWESVRNTMYKERVWEPPSSAITFGRRFLESADGLSPDRLYNLNTRIDQLAVYLESGRQHPLKSLDYKAIKGGPHGQATHEFDAWADRDARRVYCQEEGSQVVLIELGAKLR
ncbi:MAG: hypothetical protein H0U74_01355 [Bradymonadaceae bacterium]|nr:hypothetical protein [Lujinxingiaceae bacterium]